MLEILEGEYKEICKRVGKSKKLSVLDMLIIMLGNDHDVPESRKIIELLNCKTWILFPYEDEKIRAIVLKQGFIPAYLSLKYIL